MSSYGRNTTFGVDIKFLDRDFGTSIDLYIQLPGVPREGEYIVRAGMTYKVVRVGWYTDQDEARVQIRAVLV